MPVGRSIPLAVASGTIAAACATAPWLPWLTASGNGGHCGWSCYRAAPGPTNVAALAGRGGTQMALGLGALLLVLAALLAVVAVIALQGRRPPVLLGRVLSAGAFVALVWTVLLIVRYAEGGTLVRTRQDGTFAAGVGGGAVVALVAAAAAVLFGGGIALRARWAGYEEPEGAAGSWAPGRSRS